MLREHFRVAYNIFQYWTLSNPSLIKKMKFWIKCILEFCSSYDEILRRYIPHVSAATLVYSTADDANVKKL